MKLNNKTKQRRSFRLNKQTLVWLGSYIKRTVKRLPEQLLLQHNRWVEGSILAVFIVASLWIIFSFLFLVPGEEITGPRKTELSIPAINELELWLEDRQTAYERTPSFPSRVINVQ
ncbi:MAG: hypothetical protein WEC84_01640 [Candidatus Andersenbacteria bacterium]